MQWDVPGAADHLKLLEEDAKGSFFFYSLETLCSGHDDDHADGWQERVDELGRTFYCMNQFASKNNKNFPFRSGNSITGEVLFVPHWRFVCVIVGQVQWERVSEVSGGTAGNHGDHSEVPVGWERRYGDDGRVFYWCFFFLQSLLTCFCRSDCASGTLPRARCNGNCLGRNQNGKELGRTNTNRLECLILTLSFSCRSSLRTSKQCQSRS